MPKRFCTCTGCAACKVTSRTHGAIYDAESTRGLKCPACQAIVTARRNERPSSSQRGLGWKFSQRKKNDRGYQEATVCHWCRQPFTPGNPKTADHLQPRSQGGAEGPIVAACRSCNSRRGGKLGHS